MKHGYRLYRKSTVWAKLDSINHNYNIGPIKPSTLFSWEAEIIELSQIFYSKLTNTYSLSKEQEACGKKVKD